MSADAHAHDPNSPEVYFQFEDIDQQQETYIVGMWAFLAQEIMFFGGLFLMYTIYRSTYQTDWYNYHLQLDYRMGAINTTILLMSSLFAALAVHFSQKKNRKWEIRFLGLVVLCAFGFLGVKTIEYGQKFEHHLFPNYTFQYGGKVSSAMMANRAEGGEISSKNANVVGDPNVNGARIASRSRHTEEEAPGFFTQTEERLNGVWPKEVSPETGNPDKARLFFSLYFIMTGLHGLHVIIGILLFLVLIGMIVAKSKALTDYIPTEMLCLYWHFVDLVWIFLYPLFYLIPK